MTWLFMPDGHWVNMAAVRLVEEVQGGYKLKFDDSHFYTVRTSGQPDDEAWTDAVAQVRAYLQR